MIFKKPYTIKVEIRKLEDQPTERPTDQQNLHIKAPWPELENLKKNINERLKKLNLKKLKECNERLAKPIWKY